MRLAAVFILVIIKFSLAKDVGAPCKTPDNQEGTCIQLKNCPSLIKAIQSTYKVNVEIVRQSFCGYVGPDVLVCCSSRNNETSTTLVSSDFGLRGSQCITPNNETAICTSLYNCSTILEAIKTRHEDHTEFAKRSQCGYDTEPLVCCGTGSIPTSNSKTQDERSLLPNVIMCGLDFAPRIKYGYLTHITEYPWLAMLEYEEKSNRENKEWKCDGSLIHSRYVLTAAHCTRISNYKLSAVRLGEWQLSTDPDCVASECGDPIKRFRINEIIVHPSYNPVTYKNDIGLLRLEKNVDFTEYVHPICLPNKEFSLVSTSPHLTISGWGLINNGSVSDIKMQTDVALLHDDVCINRNSSIQSLAKFQKCIGQLAESSCWADSGGPVMRKDFGEAELRWFQEGVISWTAGCNRTMYTSISPYASWISTTIEHH